MAFSTNDVFSQKEINIDIQPQKNLNNLKSNIEVKSNVANAVYSSTNGGDWYDPLTWLNSTIPNEDDNVFIIGKVMINSNIMCHDLNIQQNGTLQVGSKENKQIMIIVNNDLNVDGNLDIKHENQITVKNKFNRKKITNDAIINSGKIIIGNNE